MMLRFNRTPTASRSAHRGNMGAIARLSPFGAPYQLPIPGVAMGYYDNMTTYRQDIHLWKRIGLVKAPIIFADGEIGCGKTSLAIVSALNANLLSVEAGRTFKIMYEISRRNVGIAELDQMTNELDADVEDMATYGLNIFDQQFGLSKGEQLDVLLECVNYVEKRDATTLEVHIFMAALRLFILKCEADAKFAKVAKNMHYEKCLATLSYADFKLAIAEKDEWSSESEDEEPLDDEESEEDSQDDFYQDSMLTADDISYDEELFLRVRDDCLLAVARLRKGEYGRVFNGRHSFAELFDRRALGVDMTNLNEATVGLVQTLFWKFKRSAANSTDPERRARFVFDWEIHDENRESWLQAPYRREVPRYLKRIRSTNTVMWFNAHRVPGDYETLPEVARDAALNAAQESTIRFHGRHEKTPAERTCEFFGYSDRTVEAMQDQQLGDFIFVVGAMAPQKIHIKLSRTQKQTTFSEAASEGKTLVSPTLAALIG